MAAYLIVQRGEDIGRRFDLETTQLTVGRGSDNDMVLNDPMVSRYHAVVKRQGSGYLVIDLGSSNPVVINDQVCEPGEPRVLQHRDVVFIGKTVFSFQNRGGGAATGANVGRSQSAGGQTLFVSPPGELESPTPPPPARSSTPPPSMAQEERTSTSTSKLDPPTAQTPAQPPAASEEDTSNDDRTVVSGVGRQSDPGIAPFTPPPPPPSTGLRGIEDDSTRQTPGMPSGGPGAPPPPPPPFAPPPQPLGGTTGGQDENDDDMRTMIVPRRP